MTLPPPTHYRVELTTEDADTIIGALRYAQAHGWVSWDEYLRLYLHIQAHPFYADDEPKAQLVQTHDTKE